MAAFVGERESGVARAPRLLVVAEQPERVRQAGQADDLGVLRVANQVRGPLLGAAALDGSLEVGARGLEPALPVGRDPENVGAFHPQHVVSFALAAGAQLLAEGARGLEVAAGQARKRERAHERRLRLDAEHACELGRALVDGVQAIRQIALDPDERSGERGEQPELELVALGARRHASRELERPLEQAHRLVVRV